MVSSASQMFGLRNLALRANFQFPPPNVQIVEG